MVIAKPGYPHDCRGPVGASPPERDDFLRVGAYAVRIENARFPFIEIPAIDARRGEAEFTARRLDENDGLATIKWKMGQILG